MQPTNNTEPILPPPDGGQPYQGQPASYTSPSPQAYTPPQSPAQNYGGGLYASAPPPAQQQPYQPPLPAQEVPTQYAGPYQQQYGGYPQQTGSTAGTAWQTPQPFAGPQPGYPVLPAQSQAGQAYYQNYVPAGAKPRFGMARLRLFALVAVVAALLLGIGAIAWSLQQQSRDPSRVFMSMLENSLQLTSVKQISDLGGNAATVVFDTKDMSDPRVSARASVNLYGITVDLEGYGTLRNSYLRYNRAADASDSVPAEAPFLQKWVQLRKDGQLDTDVDSTMAAFADPRHYLFGQHPIGNFTTDQQRELLTYLQENEVYTFDANQVRREKLNDRDVLVYEITFSKDKLKEYNRKVAATLGMQEADIQDVLNYLDLMLGARFYVDVGSKQLVKATGLGEGWEQSYSYQEHNSVQAPAEPVAELTYPQLNQLLNTSL